MPLCRERCVELCFLPSFVIAAASAAVDCANSAGGGCANSAATAVAAVAAVAAATTATATPAEAAAEDAAPAEAAAEDAAPAEAAAEDAAPAANATTATTDVPGPATLPPAQSEQVEDDVLLHFPATHLVQLLSILAPVRLWSR